ncbi:MAG: adenylosuccinate lyase, partial [Acetobacteraceae bacterium]|nr:adenylosuccinate lyase [Acetobacteraceae bacterium]
SSMERLAIEIRHLQRTEVLEAEEFFSEGQKGSSAMPHKRNPVTCERLAGLARVLRANVVAGMENVALWHERDISHSSVERVIAPDATIALDFALARATGMRERLVGYAERMKANLDALGGVVHSQKVLLALTQAGMSREDAYAAVQSAAMRTWEALGAPGGRPFRDELLADPAVRARLDPAALDAAMDPRRDFAHVDMIFDRVFTQA